MRTILIQADVKGINAFRDMLALQLTDFNIVLSINDAELVDIEVVIIWFYVPEFLQSLVNIKLLLICGSGVDHLIDSTKSAAPYPLSKTGRPILT